MGTAQPVSLLWPHGRAAAAIGRLSDDAVTDLHLHEIVSAMLGPDAPAGRLAARERFAQKVITELLWDAEVIAYRQDVLTDLLEQPRFRERLDAVLPGLEALGDMPRGERYRPTIEPGLERVARRLIDLELLVDVVSRLADALDETPLRSEAFRSVGVRLDQLRRSGPFVALERELPGLRATLASVRSVTVGVNLGPDLNPESATILDLGTEPIEGRRGLLSRLLGGGDGKAGLTPLQRGEASPLRRPNELVRDLQHLLGQVVAPVAAALERFSRVSTDAVAQLGPELALFLGAARLVERLRSAGLPMCRPEYVTAENRTTQLVDAYDPGLALSQLSNAASIVTNPVCFDERLGRVWVLTGPNRGGKTTYARTVGLAQVLFQAGMYIPASTARLSPADAIYTHFPGREDTRPGLGRLDLEAERLAAIFHQATPRSLILLNEALSGTSALEALDLARGLVRGLRLLGARAIYVTHLHELAHSVDEINASTPGDGTVGSLLADSEAVEDGAPAGAVSVRRRTYRIVPHAPRGVSFAAEIAEQHGISFAQLAQLLRERNLASPD
jgi:DNA mismatch repair protein MutS